MIHPSILQDRILHSTLTILQAAELLADRYHWDINESVDFIVNLFKIPPADEIMRKNVRAGRILSYGEDPLADVDEFIALQRYKALEEQEREGLIKHLYSC